MRSEPPARAGAAWPEPANRRPPPGHICIAPPYWCSPRRWAERRRAPAAAREEAPLPAGARAPSGLLREWAPSLWTALSATACDGWGVCTGRDLDSMIFVSPFRPSSGSTCVATGTFLTELFMHRGNTPLPIFAHLLHSLSSLLNGITQRDPVSVPVMFFAPCLRYICRGISSDFAESDFARSAGC